MLEQRGAPCHFSGAFLLSLQKSRQIIQPVVQSVLARGSVTRPSQSPKPVLLQLRIYDEFERYDTGMRPVECCEQPIPCRGRLTPSVHVAWRGCGSGMARSWAPSETSIPVSSRFSLRDRAPEQRSGTPSRAISTRGDASGRRVGVLLRRSSTNGTATPLVRRSQRAPRSVPCRSHSPTKPREQSK